MLEYNISSARIMRRGAAWHCEIQISEELRSGVDYLRNSVKARKPSGYTSLEWKARNIGSLQFRLIFPPFHLFIVFLLRAPGARTLLLPGSFEVFDRAMLAFRLLCYRTIF
jgi:hypothetical protein